MRPLSANNLRVIENSNQPFGLRAHTVRPYTVIVISRFDFTKLISLAGYIRQGREDIGLGEYGLAWFYRYEKRIAQGKRRNF